jgi:hypothetical protein
LSVIAFSPKTKTLSAFDPAIARAQLQALQTLEAAWGRSKICELYLMILSKREMRLKTGSTRLIPFRLSPIQEDLQNTAAQRNITVKPRQIGSTTWHIICRLFLASILEPGTSGLLISQTKLYGAQHFRIFQRALKNFGRTPAFVSQVGMQQANQFADDLQHHLLHTQYSARHEILFDFLDSKVLVDTAENPDAGTGLCVDPETWIQKADGNFVRYKKLVVGDYVIGSDGNPVSVEKFFEIPAKKHPYGGQARKITLWGSEKLPITVALNHPIMTEKGMVEAQSLKVGDYVAYPKRKIVGDEKWARLKGKNRKAAAQPFFVGDVKLDRDFGLICGLYLSDGNLQGNRAVSITMATPRKMEWALARVLARAKSFVKSPRFLWIPSKGKKSIRLNSVSLTAWMEKNFGRARGKNIPLVWSRWPREFLVGLFEGWIAGDAWWHFPGGVTGYGSNPKIVCQMKEIAIALGFGLPLLTWHSHHGKRKFVIKGVERKRNYRRHFHLNFYGQSARNIAKEIGYSCRQTLLQEDKRKTWKQNDNWVYIKIRKIGNRKLEKFLDITVSGKDHLYCLPYALTHNTINHLVATEVAYWKRDPETLLAQAKEAIPSSGTMDLESTPNGMGGYFFEEWQRAKDPLAEFRQHFYPWWAQEEYKADYLREQKYQIGNSVIDFEDKPVTDEEMKMVKEFAWTMKQIAWKRGKVISLRKRFEEKYPENPATCWLTTGDLFFDKDILREIKMRVMNESPMETFHEGTLKIYKRRIPGRRYIIGADAAEGKLISTDNPDRNAAVVLDLETGEECAAYSSVLPPEDFAQDLVDLAQMYNNAMLAPERNGPGQSVILTIQRQLLYGNLYMHKEWWRERKQVILVAGFPTSMRTRPIALNKLAASIRNSPEFWHDEESVDEMLTFVWMSSNRTQFGGKRVPQGAMGCKDDRVAARWVAEYCRLVSIGYLDPIETPSERYGDYGEPEEEAA